MPGASPGIQHERPIMSSKMILTDTMAHLEWADATVWSAAFDCEGAADDERLRFLLHHIHTVQDSFLHFWRGEDIAYRELDTFADGPALAAWGRGVLAEVRAWLADRDSSFSVIVQWEPRPIRISGCQKLYLSSSPESDRISM